MPYSALMGHEKLSESVKTMKAAITRIAEKVVTLKAFLTLTTAITLRVVYVIDFRTTLTTRKATLIVMRSARTTSALRMKFVADSVEITGFTFQHNRTKTKSLPVTTK